MNIPQIEIHSHNHSGTCKVRLQLCYIESDSESAIMRDSIHMRTPVQGDQKVSVHLMITVKKHAKII
jgi:hypothetical protein